MLHWAIWEKRGRQVELVKYALSIMSGPLFSSEVVTRDNVLHDEIRCHQGACIHMYRLIDQKHVIDYR